MSAPVRSVRRRRAVVRGPWHAPSATRPTSRSTPRSPGRSSTGVAPTRRCASSSRRPVVGGGGADAPRDAHPTATRSSAASGPTASSVSASRTWPATGTPTTSAAVLRAVRASASPTLVPPWMQRLRRFYVRHQPSREENTIAGARRNIERHYDLSNDLFALFLDESMTYSSALFEPGDTLEQRAGTQDRPAARRGRRRLRHPPARDRHRLGRARDPRRRARRHGHDAHAVARAAARSRASGPPRPVSAIASTCSCATTARSTGTYDAVVSVEMIEAVGERVLADLLRHARPAARARRSDRASRRSCSSTTGCSRRATSTRGSTSTSSPAARCRRCGRSTRRRAPHTTLRIDRPVPRSAPTTRDAARVAGALRRARRRGRRARLRRDRSAACGTSTSRTARPASPPATSTSSSSCSRARGT